MSLALTEIAAAWPYIILAWTALFLVAASPGPTAVAIMGIAMSKGRRAGLLFTSGCMTGSTIWAISAGLGLSVWLTNYANSVTILKMIGGVYLLWMGYKSLRSALTRNDKLSSKSDMPHKHLYFKGLALHLTNPKAILGWAAVITLSQTETHSVSVLIFTLVGCLVITFSIHFSYALLFASRVSINIYAKSRRWIEGILAAIFGYAALRLLTDEIR